MPERAVTGPRVLLRQLREVMAASRGAQAQLDRITGMIASNMVAEVCSIYLIKNEGILELFATEGLRPDAVHMTTLKVGEGLVGDIAEHAHPLNLADAQASPKFAYRPETGEEEYHSLMGVPILKAGNVLGVLAVQNRTKRHYSEEEVEALETVAMVIAELAASQIMSSHEDQGASDKEQNPQYIKGLALADGIAQGEAVFHDPRIEVGELIADSPAEERARLDAAMIKVKDSIDELFGNTDLGSLKDEHREILETYRMFAHDQGWIKRITEAVDQGLTAEAAVERVHNDTRARMLRMTDPYLRERLHDLDDLANRLLRTLVGQDETAPDNLPDNAILIARNMGPADLLEYDRVRLKGIVLEDGSPTSHVAIIARALAIPMVGRIKEGVDGIEAGDQLVVDGDRGEVHIRPPGEIITAYETKMALRAQRIQEFAEVRDKRSITQDQVIVDLNINAGLDFDLPFLEETNASGIGLFRTELQFMVSPRMPRLRDQVSFYKQVLEAAGDKPVIFRTLDLGGDKILPYGRQIREENPALGWRAIRIALDRPALLRYQLRALMLAAGGRVLNVMFPMVADVNELEAARVLVDQETAYLRRYDKERPKTIRLGVMIEVPSLAHRIAVLKGRVDFLSVGSNDLLQFYLASDRGNPRLADRYERLSPVVLSILADIARDATAADIPLSLCGEMAGRPLEAMALLGLGFRSLSMPPASIGPVKLMVRSLNVGELRELLLPLLDSPAASLRQELKDYANQAGVLV